ncbi:MAG: HK97 gp10 family phage protein [Hespellia sp.]|nr:HK97 gp10 family phage protein [Hespellia sp.]
MGVRIVGMEKLQAKLKKNCTLDDVKKVVSHNGAKMTEKMKKNTETAFTKGYSGGDTASSINQNITDGGMTTEAGATMDYDEYVEYGTRFMEAEPFVKPAFEEQKEKFKSDMKRLTR